MRRLRQIIGAALTVTLATGALGIAEEPAAASDSTQEPAVVVASSYCSGPGSCPVFSGPNSSLQYAHIPNFTLVQMICWTDNQWHSVNYWSDRWFKVSTPYTSTTWMHSSEVYSQTTTPHC